MVTKATCPFTIKSRLVVPKMGAQGKVEAILDMGCTQCLISLPLYQKLGIWTRPLTNLT